MKVQRNLMLMWLVCCLLLAGGWYAGPVLAHAEELVNAAPPVGTMLSLENSTDTAPQSETVKTPEPSEQVRETSRTESFFAVPPPYVGSAVAGAPVVQDEQEVSAEAEAFLKLQSQQDSLSLSEKANLFLQLSPQRKDFYLQSLPYTERVRLLSLLGEGERWFSKDLQVKQVDRTLEQFGYAFFQGGGGDFTPDRLAPVSADYILGPGDQLLISLWGGVEGQYEVSVGRDGSIVLPKIGKITIWGESYAEAKKTLQAAIGSYYKDFDFSLTLGALRSIQIYLVGEIARPGSYNLSAMSTVMTALVDSGGVSKSGSLRKIELRRHGALVATLDFYKFLLQGDRASDLRLRSGDTVFVPVVGSQVGVAGDVRRPAIYELSEEETLGDVLHMAGGLRSTAYLGQIQIERVKAHKHREIIDLRLTGETEKDKSVLSTPVFDGDFLRVQPISPQVNSYVRLLGHVAHPGRYQFRSGMRVSDLFTTYDNLLPDYFPGFAEILRMNSPSLPPEKVVFDLDKALQIDPKQNLALQELDEVRIFSREEMEETPHLTVSGAVLRPGTYRYFNRMTLKDLIATAGNLKRGAYLAKAELTRYQVDHDNVVPVRRDIDLTKVMQGNPSENIVLQPDDHLMVRMIPNFGHKNRVVVKGKVVFPGSFTITPGEKLSSVLKRAGGFAEGAYLRGAVFSRESVKELQQERLQQLVQKQEQRIVQVSSEMAQGAFSEQDVKGAEALLQSRKEVLGQLKETPVSGRMVIQLTPLDSFSASEYDFELVDGDEIVIPENPHTVAVMGEVYNPTALSYHSEATLEFYLSKAGGATELANEDEIFIVRADGSVVSRQQSGGFSWNSSEHEWVSGRFLDLPLYPGDTVLVPQEVKQLDIMREVKDLTTILYQMALGAAAVASF